MKKITVNYIKNCCIYNGGTFENMYHDGARKNDIFVKEKRCICIKLSELTQSIIDYGLDLFTEDNFFSVIYDNDTEMVSISEYYRYSSEDMAEWYADQIGSDVVKF